MNAENVLDILIECVEVLERENRAWRGVFEALKRHGPDSLPAALNQELDVLVQRAIDAQQAVKAIAARMGALDVTGWPPEPDERDAGGAR